MKVMVAGSYAKDMEDFQERLVPEFRSACEQLGRAILDHKHTLVTSTSRADDYEFADPNVLLGAERSDRLSDLDIPVEVYAPDSDLLAAQLREVEQEEGEPVSEFRSRYPSFGMKIGAIEFRKNWQTGQAAAVSRSDVVIIIGGRDSAATILALANAMRKPVIGVAMFGGVGHKYFLETNSAQLNNSNLALETIRAIEYWDKKSAEAYVRYAESLGKKTRKSLNRAYIGIGIFAILLCAVWMLLYTSKLDGEHWLRLLPIAGCSGLLGWCLAFAHNLEDYTQRVAEGLTKSVSEKALGEGLIVALLALAYGFLACEASGLYGISVDTLQADKMKTLATGITVIGFTVGALSKEAYTQLQLKLSKRELG